jgi:hypothetical protein
MATGMSRFDEDPESWCFTTVQRRSILALNADPELVARGLQRRGGCRGPTLQQPSCQTKLLGEPRRLTMQIFFEADNRVL